MTAPSRTCNWPRPASCASSSGWCPRWRRPSSSGPRGWSACWWPAMTAARTTTSGRTATTRPPQPATGASPSRWCSTRASSRAAASGSRSSVAACIHRKRAAPWSSHARCCTRPCRSRAASVMCSCRSCTTRKGPATGGQPPVPGAAADGRRRRGRRGAARRAAGRPRRGLGRTPGRLGRALAVVHSGRMPAFCSTLVQVLASPATQRRKSVPAGACV
jgi:hypothetical protein